MGRKRTREKKSKEKKSLQRWWQDNALVRYLRNTLAELRKVHWPGQKEAENLTKIVLGVTISMAIVMGLLDYLFALELQGLIARNAIAIGVAVFSAVASTVVVVILKRQAPR